jgi:hypothetical protein
VPPETVHSSVLPRPRAKRVAAYLSRVARGTEPPGRGFRSHPLMIWIVLARAWADLQTALALRLHAILRGILPETLVNIVGARCWVGIHLARALGGLNELDRLDFLLDGAVILIVKAWPRDMREAVRLLARLD